MHECAHLARAFRICGAEGTVLHPVCSCDASVTAAAGDAVAGRVVAAYRDALSQFLPHTHFSYISVKPASRRVERTAFYEFVADAR